jgi:hypothetical protein
MAMRLHFSLPPRLLGGPHGGCDDNSGDELSFYPDRAHLMDQKPPCPVATLISSKLRARSQSMPECFEAGA